MINKVAKSLIVAVISSGLAGCSDTSELLLTKTAIPEAEATPEPERVISDLSHTEFGKLISLAVLADPALSRSRANVRVAQAEQRAAKGAFFPSVSVGFSAENRNVNSSSTSSASPYLRISQLVFDAGASRSLTQAADARFENTEAEQLQAAAQSALEAIEVYATLFASRRLVVSAEKNLKVLKEFTRQIDERVASGVGSTADQLTAQSRIADAQILRVEAQSQRDRAEAAFDSRFSGTPKPLPDLITAPNIATDEADFLSRSPRMHAANATVKAAEAELQAAIARRQPGVELGGMGRRASGGGADLTFDVTLNYSFDTRGEARAAISAAQAQYEGALADRENLEHELREQFAVVRSDQETGRARLAAARKSVSSNATSVEAAREQFRIGRRTMIQLLDAQRDFLQAEQTLIRAERDHFLTDYAILALTGDILDVFEISVTGTGQ